MDIVRLHAEAFLSLPGHGYASIITDPEQLVVCHCHDYYEIFVVSRGMSEHVINGTRQKLEPGLLYCVRPDDVHYYENFTSTFQLINIIVPYAAMQQFFAFVGDSFYTRRLLTPVLPPHTALSLNELDTLMAMLQQLLISGKIMKRESETLFRIAMFNILTTYFPVLPQKNSLAIPDWLQIVSIEMTKKPNFTEGLPALYRLAGKSVEHFSRV